MSEPMEKKEESKLLRGVNALITIVLIFAVALCVYIVFQLITSGQAGIGDYRMFRVVTGSMEPTMSVGTLLVAKSADIADIGINDIVCFRTYDSQIYGSVVTHRVVDIVQDAGGILLQTKGDANPIADVYYVSQENLIGKVIWFTGESSVLTSAFSFLSNKFVFLGCIVFPCLLIAGLVLQNCVKNIRAELEREEEQQSEQPQADPAAALSAQEYEEMIERIRTELTKELLQSSHVPEGEHHVGISEENQTDTSK